VKGGSVSEGKKARVQLRGLNSACNLDAGIGHPQNFQEVRGMEGVLRYVTHRKGNRAQIASGDPDLKPNARGARIETDRRPKAEYGKAKN